MQAGLGFECCCMRCSPGLTLLFDTYGSGGLA